VHTAFLHQVRVTRFHTIHIFPVSIFFLLDPVVSFRLFISIVCLVYSTIPKLCMLIPTWHNKSSPTPLTQLTRHCIAVWTQQHIVFGLALAEQALYQPRLSSSSGACPSRPLYPAHPVPHMVEIILYLAVRPSHTQLCSCCSYAHHTTPFPWSARL
jgi:hypothetical protein